MDGEAMTLTQNVSVKRRYDVIVAGGGVAGAAAAVSAAKRGKSVLLLEKSNILGGLATLGQINLFVPMCNGRGKQIIFGLCDKWARMSAEYGYDTIPGEWANGEPEVPTTKRYCQRFSPYIFALQLMREVVSANVDLLFDCLACRPVMEGNRCVGVVTESKSGTELYGCGMLIDTTGDGDLMRRCGAPVVAGKNFHTYVAKLLTLDGCRRAVEEGNLRHAYDTISGGNINLYGDHQPESLPQPSGLTVEEVTDYLIRNQTEMLERLRATGRNERDVVMLPLMPQFRTTCHLRGDYTFRFEDLYRHFDDSVCAINDFENRDHLFEVPLRALTCREFPNLITAGRSASAEGYGWDVIRVIPPAIMTGQAAGEAVALALEENKPVSEVSVRTLQARLEEAGVMVHFPDSYLPDDRTPHRRGGAPIEGGHF